MDHELRKPSDRCVALVDAAFWQWLQGPEANDEGATAASAAARQLGAVLQAQARRGRLHRVYWYSPQPAPQRAAEGSHPPVLWRQVPSEAQDGGVGRLRAMAADLGALVNHHGAERLLLVSDDERLLLAIDHAQHRGVAVDMVCDTEVLAGHDSDDIEPGWARLLQLADRVLAWDADTPVQRHDSQRHGPSRRPLNGDSPLSPERQALIQRQLQDWWLEEGQGQQVQLQQHLAVTRGLPQELDRLLLQRISRASGESLSPQEKREMRDGVRRMVEA